MGEDLIELAFGADVTAHPAAWRFTDVSQWLSDSAPITLKFGASSESGETEPAECTLDLDNPDGRFTPDDARSPYWPDVEQGTPFRYRRRRVTDAFGRTLTEGWGSADTGQPWSTIAVGGTIAITDWAMSGGQAQHRVPATLAYRASWLAGVRLADQDVAVTFSCPLPTGAALEPANLILRVQDLNVYYMARTEIAPSGAVTLKLFESGSGTQLAAATAAGITYTAGLRLRVRAIVVGPHLMAKVWTAAGVEPDAWTVWATDTAITAPGGLGVRSGVASGNTNPSPRVFSYDDFVAYAIRFQGAADDWLPRYGDGDSDVTVRLTAAGLSRRLGQGTPALRSAAYRAIIRTDPIAYWPCEDADGAGAAASAVPDVAPMTPMGVSRFQYPDTLAPIPAAGPPKFGNGDAPGGSDKVIDLASGGMLRGIVPRGYTFEWQIDWVATFAPNANAAEQSTVSVLEWRDAGTYAKWEFVVGDKFCWVFHGDDSSNAGSGSVPIELFNGNPYHFRMLAMTDTVGGVIVARFYINGVFMFESDNFGAAMTGTLGGITEVRLNPKEEKRDALPSIGHVAVWAPYDPAPGTNLAVAVHGWLAESAAARAVRLCEEEGVPLSVIAGDTPAMGPQRTQTLLEHLREIERTTGGILWDAGHQLLLRPLDSIYNQQPALTAAAESPSDAPFRPRYDDKGVRNTVTASRPGGGSVTVVDEDHVRRRGTYDGSVKVNTYDDGPLTDHASWRVYMGTRRGARIPSVGWDLVTQPELAEAWMGAAPGDRLAMVGTPAQHPDDVDVLLRGWTETVMPHGQSQQVVAATTNYAPYNVAEADGDQRAGADGSSLAAVLALGAMSFSLASTVANGTWVTGNTVSNPTDFPMDVRVGGERVRISGISGVTSPQIATVAAGGRGINGVTRSWPAGTPVDVWEPAIAPQ